MIRFQNMARTTAAVEQDAVNRRLLIRAEECKTLRENLVFVIRMMQDGTEPEEGYEFYHDMFRGQLLFLLLNRNDIQEHSKNN